MNKEWGPHLKDFPIGAATQPLQQIIVVPGVPIKDVGVHEVHPWGPELGLCPGANRASGLECWRLPSSPQALHPPCLASTGCGLPPPQSRFLPQHKAVQPAPPPVPWAQRACEGFSGDLCPPPGPRTECKPDANYLIVTWGGGALALHPPFWEVAKNHSCTPAECLSVWPQHGDREVRDHHAMCMPVPWGTDMHLVASHMWVHP